MGTEQDWRLEVEVGGADPSAVLERVIGRVRAPRQDADDPGPVGAEVVISHDGELLFAYANSRRELDAARAAIEGALSREGVSGDIEVSHWDSSVDRWHVFDPNAAGDVEHGNAPRDEHDRAVDTRTVVANAGKLVRQDFERSMRQYAEQLGVKCTISEHRHLLSTQVAFTLIGPARKLDEFAAALKAEGAASVRADAAILNPF